MSDISKDEESNNYIGADPFCHHLGVEFEMIEPGTATAHVTTTAEMLNFNGTVHGGVVFTLADATAAAAENAAGGKAIGLETSTSFLTPVSEDETITAQAESVHRSRKTTLTYVTVENEAGDSVATFSGRGYRFD